MNEFVALLLARSRGAEGVRPRLASRFEGLGAAFPVVDSSEVEPAPRAPTLVERFAPPHEARAPHHPTSVLGDEAPVATGPVAASLSQSQSQPAAAMAPRIPAAEVHAQLHARAMVADEASPRVREAAVRPGEFAGRPEKASAPARSAAAPDAMPVPTAASRSPQASAEPPSRRMPDTPRVAVPLRQEPPLARMQPAAARRAAPEETTVHVSIGRVDVRLDAPPAARGARREAAAPAVMTLDEYLRSRAG